MSRDNTEPSVTLNDDYAVVEGGGYHAYYGYEFGSVIGDDPDIDEQWGFEMKRSGESVFRISADEMREKCKFDQFDTNEGLLYGIALYWKSVAEKESADVANS